jgi:TonB family protein
MVFVLQRMMKPTYKILLIILFLPLHCFGQIQDTSMRVIKTGNWMELSFKAINKAGETVPFIMVQEMPQYPGGWDSLSKFLLRNLNYPKKAIDLNIEGRVYTSFTVDSKGKVGNCKTFRGVNPVLDSTCLHIVSIIPDWTPFKSTDNQILIQYLLPVRFILTRDGLSKKK